MSPIYAYRGRSERGDRVSGRLEAPSEDTLTDLLRSQGLYVTSVEEQRTERGARPAAATRRPAGDVRVKRRDLIVFTVHLATVLSSGIAITTGLAAFADEGPSAALKRVARALLDGVEGGATLSEAMAWYPRAFPELYVSLVQAGETVGQVDRVLFDLAASLEWQENLVSQVRQASIYPLMLLVALTGMVTLIVTVVMPRFVTALTRAGVELPLATRLVVALGDFVTAHWLSVLLGGVWAVVGFRWYVGTPQGRYAWDAFKLRIPLIGELVRRVGLSRFAHHLAQLERSGVNFVAGLRIVEGVVGNQVLARAVARARDRIIAGSTLTQALRETGEFPPLVLQMVATGESSGSLSETLQKVVQYYDREVPAAVRRITTMMEPIVYVILGAVVLGTALALYSPLLAMLNKIQVRPRF